MLMVNEEKMRENTKLKVEISRLQMVTIIRLS